jgi:transcriptional regulator with XRE-family HTH domain
MFHLNLKRQRQAAGLTQAALAKRLKRPLQTLQGWEAGRRWPRLDVLPALAEALACTTDDLLAGMAKPKGRPRKKWG